MDPLRYPIGEFVPPDRIDAAQLAAWIESIATLPADLRRVVEPLAARDEAWLDRRYRPGGWTARQVVHHVADSHVNSYVRFRWALTEERPTIKTYDEKRWAELPDARGPIAPSLDLLDALHVRWVVLLRSLTDAELERELVHPDSGPIRLAANVGAYAWHGRHHLAHVEGMLAREGWSG